jgi:hypothetical protein
MSIAEPQLDPQDLVIKTSAKHFPFMVIDITHKPTGVAVYAENTWSLDGLREHLIRDLLPVAIKRHQERV